MKFFSIAMRLLSLLWFCKKRRTDEGNLGQEPGWIFGLRDIFMGTFGGRLIQNDSLIRIKSKYEGVVTT